MVKDANSSGVLSTEAELKAALVNSFPRSIVLLNHSEWCERSQGVIGAHSSSGHAL